MTTDYWKLTKEFKPNDFVQKIDIIGGDLSPYMGRVTNVLKGIGFLDVQWPFGHERVSPDMVVKIDPAFSRILPPSLLDQSLSTYDRSKTASTWNTLRTPPKLYLDLAQYYHNKVSSVLAYDNLYRVYGSTVEDETIRTEVEKFYNLAKNAGLMRIQVAAQKQGFENKEAAYWVAQNRTHRATPEEMRVGKPSCPRCATSMRKATYKMHEGAKVKLFACNKCLYLLDPSSVLAPSGEPHNWF